MLVSKGITAGHFNDMLFEWLGTLGFTGTLNDRQLAFWSAGAPLGADLIVDGDFPNLANWTTLPSSTVLVSPVGTLVCGTTVNGARRGAIAVNPGGFIAVTSGQQYTLQITVSDAGPVQPIRIGMADEIGTTDRVVIVGPNNSVDPPHTFQGFWDVTITENVRPVVYTDNGNTLFNFDVQNFSMRSTS